MGTERVMMRCGHSANATMVREGKVLPCCAICLSLGGTVDALTPVEQPNLEGRMARCSYARADEEVHEGGGQYRGRTFNSTRPSNVNLAFFEHKPDEDEDRFYCGCFGWD